MIIVTLCPIHVPVPHHPYRHLYVQYTIYVHWHAFVGLIKLESGLRTRIDVGMGVGVGPYVVLVLVRRRRYHMEQVRMRAEPDGIGVGREDLCRPILLNLP